MSLTAGTHLGPYQVLGKLGEGGMGEVYRARDTTLDRDVAIKVLPEAFAGDAERLARFTREAKTLASLNQANIAQIYGVEEAEGVRALVMELVDGEDLSAHLARGPIPVPDALAIARHIANALEAAHELGIVHRDLKPANIKVRTDGTVKVLDFGLAKALGAPGAEDPGVQGSGNAANSPTLTARATQMGMIIGTAAYMAPEQARGKPVDRRADIWAFGVVLYEMLTGRRAFEGDEVSDVLAAVLRQDFDFMALPPATPPAVRRLLRRCLEKDPRKRLSAIGDARLDLDDTEPAPAAAPSAAAVPAPARAALFSRLWPAAAGVLVTAAVALFLWPGSAQAPAGRLARFSLLPPPGAELYPDSTGVAISPDGTMVAFIVGSVTQSATQLWVRPLDSMTSRRLEDADGAVLPFWSPDSRRIGFFGSSGQLKTIAATGGRATVVCDAPNGRGATWNAANVIVLAPEASGPLYRVSANGGKPEPVTTLDPAKRESGHRFPSFLPDGERFLYASLPGKSGKFDIYVGSLTGPARVAVGPMESAPVYADPGWLLYARQGVLAAQAFDLRTLTISGDPIPLPDEPTAILDPAISFTAGRATSISSTGSFAYFSSPSLNTIATWYDASGRTLGTLDAPPGHYESMRISPDGKRAVFVRSTSPSESALWLVDLARGGATPLTSGRGLNNAPVWSPDSSQVVFATDRDGPQHLYVKSVDDAAPERPIDTSDIMFKNATSWSPDGKWIVLTQLDPGTAQNIWRMPSGGGEMTPLVQSPGRDNSGEVSPDGRWLWYASDETGRFEVYVLPFPGPGPRVRISQHGAAVAWWTKDARQMLLLGVDLRTLWQVDVDPAPSFRAGTPRQIATLPSNIIGMDAVPDRRRFLAVAPERTGIGSMTVVQHGIGALKDPSQGQ